MPADFATISFALRDALAAMGPLQAVAEAPDTVTPPMAWPMLRDVDYTFDFGDVCKSRWEIHIAVAPLQVGRVVAQQMLWQYLNPASPEGINYVLKMNRSLGGAVNYATVTAARDFNSYQLNGVDYWAIKVDIEVVA
jgi:hypothetical protein